MTSEHVSSLPRQVLRWAVYATLAIALSAPLCAHAQSEATDEKATASVQAQYAQLIKEALQEFERHNWAEARALFRRAHALSPNARTHRGLGIVSFEMRDYVAALRELEAALDDARQPLTASQREEVSALLARARTFVGEYAVTLTPADAIWTLDGGAPELLEDGSLRLSLGTHVIRARAEGYEAGQLQVDVTGGEQQALSLVLERAKAPAATSDAAPTSAAPSAPSKADSSRGERGFRWTWGLGAGAVAFAGAGVALWYTGAAKLDDLDTRCEAQAAPCTKSNTDTSSLELHETLTNVSFGVAGALLIATAIVLPFEWPREQHVQTAFTVGPGQLSVRGKF